MNWDEPIALAGLKDLLESDSVSLEQIPGNLCTVGIISGYRVIHECPDFREVHFEISQGQDEELRLHYIGEPLLSVLLNLLDYLWCFIVS